MPCVKKAFIFPPNVKNRRFHPYEMQTEKELCKIFLRPPRHFIFDEPFYPWLPPEPKVNFDLKYKE